MILHGNNIDVLKTFADGFFDSVVTDPPYGLKFMGKKWDYEVPQVELWKEVLRVLKPGGHMLCACGTRTQHRMAVNIEDAGFEIRDVITWHYGSGFPKSLDVSKAIDKAAGAEREIVSTIKKAHISQGNTNEGWHRPSHLNEDGTFKNTMNITAPATDAAKKWEGWGTALKPATEFWTMARKPFDTTVAANVLEHGTGGLNIDGCRIAMKDGDKQDYIKKRQSFNNTPVNTGWANSSPNLSAEDYIRNSTEGRFPSNLVFSCDCEGPHEEGCPVGELDRQSGILTTGAVSGRNPANQLNPHTANIKAGNHHHPSSGTASRFFYVAKASKSERNMGLQGMPKKQGSGLPMRSKDGNRGGEGIDGTKTDRLTENENTHPTVKPVTLMRYLCRMITPPKGKVLDPFNGSGTTGVACAKEWFEYYGIEQEEEHVQVSIRRMPPPDLFT